MKYISLKNSVCIDTKGKWTKSCTTSPFLIAKLSHLKITFIEHEVMTLLFMTYWTRLNNSLASCARKPKVLNAKGIKMC